MAEKFQKFAAPLLQAHLEFSACTDVLGFSSGIIQRFNISRSASVAGHRCVGKASHPWVSSAVPGHACVPVWALLLLASSRRGEMETPASPGMNQIKLVN